MTQERDFDLVARVQRGDSEAWEAFLARVGDIPSRVSRWRKWGFSPEDQADASQQLILSIRQALPAYKEGSALHSFIYTVCVRRCIDTLRRKVRSEGLFIPTVIRAPDGDLIDRDFVDEAADPVRAIMRDEMARMLRESVAELNPLCQEAIKRIYLEGLTYKEFSSEKGIAVNTAGSRLHKCMAKLRAVIKKSPAMREYFSVRNDVLV